MKTYSKLIGLGILHLYLMSDSYNIIKSLHIIFMVSWFAGLFYIVRLFIYYVEADKKESEEKLILQNQYKIMQKRLWYIIAWPAMVLTVIFGTWMLILKSELLDFGYMHIKLLFAGLLLIYHFICHKVFSNLQKGIGNYTSGKLRIWNEVATLFLVAIVFIIELKDSINWVYGVVGFFSVAILLMLGIKMYKKYRSK
jgi:protoporphyrinogen IX oxidase